MNITKDMKEHEREQVQHYPFVGSPIPPCALSQLFENQHLVVARKCRREPPYAYGIHDGRQTMPCIHHAS